MERKAKREEQGAKTKADAGSQPQLDSVHCPQSGPPPRPSVLCHPMALGGGPALLWSAEDMDPVADSDVVYVPTQLYPAQPAHCPQSLSPLAKRRWRLMAATRHSNATVGKIYIGDAREPLEWAGDNVGYVIDASDGRSNV